MIRPKYEIESAPGSSEDESNKLNDLPPANPLQMPLKTQSIQAKHPLYENNELPYNVIHSLLKPEEIILPQAQNFFTEAANLNEVLSHQQHNTNIYSSLFDYYVQNHQNLVYKKYESSDLNQPVQMGNKRYFATIVYDLKKNVKCTYNSIQPPLSVKQIQPPESNITFDAKFESGNLFCAFQKSQNEYDLVLQNDINSKGHTQWFFFAVNIKKKDTIKFRILNLMKSGSLFQQGMQPLIYSEVQSSKQRIGWFRDGINVQYQKSAIKRETCKEKYFYTLSFTIQFKHENDRVWIAHSYPYTFTQLGLYLNNLFNDNDKSRHISRKTLVRSVAGNKCEILTITSASLKHRSMRKGIFLLARQHPGEPQGSYMIEGVIDFLLSEIPEAQYIRNAAVIKIVPMVNVDGVIVGNYRCSLSGADLNRRWKNPKKKIHPEIVKIKEVLKSFTKERQVRLVCDFHGHSRKMSSFFYGCISAHPVKYLNPRIFPYLLSQRTQLINYQFSTFGVQPGKDKTARVRIYQEMRIPLVYTLEASFYGQQRKQSNKGTQVSSLNDTQHFTINDYKEIGKQFCLGLYKILYEEMGPVEVDELHKSSSTPLKAEDNIQSMNIKELEEQLINQLGDINKEDQNDSAGSDTDVSEDNLEDDLMIDILPIESLTKKQKKFKDQQKDVFHFLLNKQARKDSVQPKKSIQPKEPPIKPVERPKSIQNRDRRPMNWMIDRNKKKEEVKEPMKQSKIMVDKCIQTDEKIYKDWLKSQQLERAKLLIENSMQQTGGSRQFHATSQKNLTQQSRQNGPYVPSLQIKVNTFQTKNFKINQNFHYPVQPANVSAPQKPNLEEGLRSDQRIVQQRTQSAVRKPSQIAESTKYQNMNNYLISSDYRYSSALHRNHSRLASFSDQQDQSFQKNGGKVHPRKK